MKARKRTGIGEEVERLLLRSESEFIADPQRRSLEYWHEVVFSAKTVIPIALARQYALDNHWVERRQSFWKGVQAAWLKQRHVQLIQQRSAELHQAADLRGKAYELIRPKVDEMGVERFPIQPKSWEGAVRAFVALDDMVETKRDAILGQLEPMLAATEEISKDGPAALPFSQEEMRDIAHGLLRRRRKRRRLEMGIEDDDEANEADNKIDEAEGGSQGVVARSEPGEGGVAS